MNARPSVSVVIPTYNRHAGALAAARSALAQTWPPLEVIIVDDGSADDKAALREACAELSVRLIELERNQGGAVARNTGVDAARGDWVAFLDSDDTWVPDKLERQFRQLGNDVERPNVLAAGNVLVMEPDGSSWLHNLAAPAPDQDLSEYFLIDGGTLQTSTLLLPAALARTIRFNDALRRHQDWDFVLRLVRGGAVVSYIHDALAVYDNEPTETRVSRGGSVAPSLKWFALAGDLITPQAKHVFYMDVLIRRHLAEDRLGAWRTLAQLSIAYPAGVPRTIMRLTRRHLSRLLARRNVRRLADSNDERAAT